jgi:hypothetical protein
MKTMTTTRRHVSRPKNELTTTMMTLAAVVSDGAR